MRRIFRRTGLAPLQLCNSNTILLFDHERLCTPTTGEHSNPTCGCGNVAAGLWVSRSCTFVSCRCLPAKLDKREGGNTRSAAVAHRERQELLWRPYFQDPTFWWHDRQDKQSGSSPDFRHKEPEEPFWLNNSYESDWVDGQLTLLDTQIREPARPASTLLDNCSRPTTVPNCRGDLSAHTISRLCEEGQLSEAVDALSVLVQTQSLVSTSLLYSILKKCVAEKNLVVGRRVHDLTVKLGYRSNAFLGNHILRMYACQGRLQEAMDVFTGVAKPSPFMWCSIISAYAKHGKPTQAIQLYHEMRGSGVQPDGHIFVAALQACAIAGDLESGGQVHADMLDSGIPPDPFVCSSLVNMYAKCGKLEDARKLFDTLATKNVATWNAMISGYAECGKLDDACRLFDTLVTKNVVTWNAMISGYAEHGLGQQALALYARMEQESLILADGFTFACLLKACASVGALQQGKQLHSQISERGLEGDIVVGSCLVDMYAKCGKLEDARKVFDSLGRRDVVAWNAMINGYGRSSEGHRAIACFQEMLLAGAQPDDITFTCLLVACSHEGLVNEGHQYFNAMVEQHGVMPTIEHYNCMVDLLGRAGHLDEAETLLLTCGSKTDAVGLRALLNACKSHGDMERGIRCYERLVRLDPRRASAYVLMANMYADAGRWADVDRVERVRKLAGATKKPAVAGIEVDKQVHTFVVGEERDDIACKVRSTNERLKEEGGHVPHTELVLKPMSEKEKEDELCGHAEKLALAYGLLNTPKGTPLLVTKNLRMCRDCHSSTEIMSRIEKRDIVVRDAYSVHRFKAGSCSCKGRP